MKTKGFTLVELLVVIAILAILATVSVVGYTSYIENANKSVAVQEMTQLRDYAMAYDLASGNKDGVVSVKEMTAAIEGAKFNVDNFTIEPTVDGTNVKDTAAVTKVTYTDPETKVSVVWTVSDNKIQ